MIFQSLHGFFMRAKKRSRSFISYDTQKRYSVVFFFLIGESISQVLLLLVQTLHSYIVGGQS